MTDQTNLYWNIPEISDVKKLSTGDMPGDKIDIGPKHIQKTQVLIQEVMRWLSFIPEEQSQSKYVISIYGGSGVGKSEIASVLAYYLNYFNIGTYILSGDNYVKLRPEKNDVKRAEILEKCGVEGLNKFLGSDEEIDFEALNDVISQFKSGKDLIHLKRLPRDNDISWMDLINFSKNSVLIIEWTHGNNPRLKGVDFPIYLHSTPQETLEHRKKRNRDKNTDSPLIAQVLELEQKKVDSQAILAKIILSKQGELLNYGDYRFLHYGG